MTKQEKTQVIEDLVQTLAQSKHFYLTDTSTLTVEKTNKLRRECFGKNISVRVVKNTLLKKAIEKTTDRDLKDLLPLLKGTTAIMSCETANEPAKVIKEFRKGGATKPSLKGAYVEESIYVGDDQLEALAAIKSKEELIGDIIGLLQSPAKNVISALQSGKNTLAGIVKTLSEKPE